MTSDAPLRREQFCTTDILKTDIRALATSALIASGTTPLRVAARSFSAKCSLMSAVKGMGMRSGSVAADELRLWRLQSRRQDPKTPVEQVSTAVKIRV